MLKNSSEFLQLVDYISSKGNVLGIINQENDSEVEVFFGDGKSKIVEFNDIKKYHNKMVILYIDIPVKDNE